jgi:hypothetical protein
VLALQQAQGRIDTENIRNEGDRLIAALGEPSRAISRSTSHSSRRHVKGLLRSK